MDLELAREVFRVLSRSPEGLSREELAQALGVGDRQARDAVALAAEKAALMGYIIGMDPETNRYVLLNLNTPEAKSPAKKRQAKRVLAYIRSYFETTYRRYSLMAQAYARAYGESPDVSQPAQPSLFEADPDSILRRVVLAWDRGDQAALEDALEEARNAIRVWR
ncbi:hypothetical protein CSW25_07105 [Thermus scotoductus]|uniref:Uncharacterized protein n=1 Tax=Thermus scotoductus TaxID=37636 RepID=A0A430RFT0_THESC|nr:hypothetical protein [Thermus scotoductus]RTG98120.1 hypothetical protein CSW49_01600 [Thermus scotoductus]RTH06660.1 hypothetical protein CSW45_01480 [Thermus scotoductus]RTH12667.1 hypothetical protein CSW46_01540 [Thermus scotoductus]RTH13605.1 hypothetical protein CSW44_01480 [Thermus scotoductus]RTH22969.1 hypothetical protein CSW42_01970 [Thermus scotoductus]